MQTSCVLRSQDCLYVYSRLSLVLKYLLGQDIIWYVVACPSSSIKQIQCLIPFLKVYKTNNPYKETKLNAMMHYFEFWWIAYVLQFDK